MSKLESAMVVPPSVRLPGAPAIRSGVRELLLFRTPRQVARAAKGS
jgi:hypothetical protein